MPILKVHHIGIGVANLAASVDFYKAILDENAVEYIEWATLGLRAATIVAGNTILEVIEPVEPKGVIAHDLGRLVAEQGTGVHHLAFEVEDIDAAVERLKAHGFQLIDDAPRRVDGGRIAWMGSHPAAGVMIELVEAGYRIC